MPPLATAPQPTAWIHCRRPALAHAITQVVKATVDQEHARVTLSLRGGVQPMLTVDAEGHDGLHARVAIPVAAGETARLVEGRWVVPAAMLRDALRYWTGLDAEERIALRADQRSGTLEIGAVRPDGAVVQTRVLAARPLSPITEVAAPATTRTLAPELPLLPAPGAVGVALPPEDWQLLGTFAGSTGAVLLDAAAGTAWAARADGGVLQRALPPDCARDPITSATLPAGVAPAVTLSGREAVLLGRAVGGAWLGERERARPAVAGSRRSAGRPPKAALPPVPLAYIRPASTPHPVRELGAGALRLEHHAADTAIAPAAATALSQARALAAEEPPNAPRPAGAATLRVSRALLNDLTEWAIAGELASAPLLGQVAPAMVFVATGPEGTVRLSANRPWVTEALADRFQTHAIGTGPIRPATADAAALACILALAPRSAPVTLSTDPTGRITLQAPQFSVTLPTARTSSPVVAIHEQALAADRAWTTTVLEDPDADLRDLMAEEMSRGAPLPRHAGRGAPRALRSGRAGERQRLEAYIATLLARPAAEQDLSHDEARVLALRAQQGDMLAAERLTLGYLRWILRLAHGGRAAAVDGAAASGTTLPFADRVSVCFEAFDKAMRTYRPDGGRAFQSWVTLVTSTMMRDASMNESRNALAVKESPHLSRVNLGRRVFRDAVGRTPTAEELVALLDHDTIARDSAEATARAQAYQGILDFLASARSPSVTDLVRPKHGRATAARRAGTTVGDLLADADPAAGVAFALAGRPGTLREDVFQRLLDRLPPKAALALRHVHGLGGAFQCTTAEVARYIGVTSASVEGWLTDGRGRLALLLESSLGRPTPDASHAPTRDRVR